jgi:hypothetical protein
MLDCEGMQVTMLGNRIVRVQANAGPHDDT